jgi:hypothetical protein
MGRRKELTLLPKSPLLISESTSGFHALHEAFKREISPHGITRTGSWTHRTDVCARGEP